MNLFDESISALLTTVSETIYSEMNKEAQFLSVAIPRPVDGLFTYRLPAQLVSQVHVGGCVQVRFRESLTHAFVVELPKREFKLPAGLKESKLKNVLRVWSPIAVVSEDVLELCRWAHEYYCVPLGEVLNCAVPWKLLKSLDTTTKSLEEQKQQKCKKQSTARQPINPVSQSHVVALELTIEQCAVLTQLQAYQQECRHGVALLEGVTGSGKTEIYIELAQKTLNSGRGVLLLVPEIALTPQLYTKFEERLRLPIAVWHSAISPGRLKKQHLALNRGEIRLIIGARSAVFAPIQNLGLIIVDEEHDAAYKQDDRVRYHARDLAIVRGKLTGSFVVLGTATPSLEIRERAQEGRFLHVKLTQRIASGGFPVIELVDLRTEKWMQGIQTRLTCPTVKEMQETLDAGEQVMVYLNRRGFAAYLLCRECGAVKNCINCSISLTVHRSGLLCHLCGHSEVIPEVCSKCQGIDLHPMGAGTESLESDLSTILHGVKVLRLDRDQMTSARRLEKLLREFRNCSANLLLGTQMLVKGHHFPGVTLVVVVLADALFRWPDFRSSERAYQVLKQVAGRSGRGEKPGRVLVQTYDPEHSVLKVLDGRMSEAAFLDNERELRKTLGYPPFGRLVRLRFESRHFHEVSLRAAEVAKYLISREIPLIQVLGPSEAFLERVKGLLRWDVVIKAKNIESLRMAVHIAKQFCVSQKWQLSIDVDPYSM